MLLKFDDEELIQTAKAVIKFNKYAKDDTPENIVVMMKRVANREPGYISTYGFVLTTFWRYGNREDGLGVKASVASHLFV